MASRLGEIAGLFLKLGTIGFGGPAAHLAMMEDEVVQRRGWMTRQYFLDLVGATNLIPGPNSTEMAIHIGFVRGGWAGLLVAGCCFIGPATLITAVFAWLYVEHGQQPQVLPMIAGIKPAVLAIIFTAGWRMGAKAIRGWILGTVAVGVGTASLFDAGEILPLLAGSLLGMLWLLAARRRPAGAGAIPPGAAPGILLTAGAGQPAAGLSPHAWTLTLASSGAAAQAVSLFQLGWFFLKIGLVLYGTGYVLVAYLQGSLVDRYGWLNESQLLDAIAIGQFTPGPILSTATFIGYVVMARQAGPLQGLAGAAVATVAVFLPSFVLVALTNPVVPRLRRSRWTAAFLDAVNAASLGLMAAVTIKLAVKVFLPHDEWLAPDWPALLIAALSSLAVLRWNVSAVWLVLSGAAAGLGFWLCGLPLGS